MRARPRVGGDLRPNAAGALPTRSNRGAFAIRYLSGAADVIGKPTIPLQCIAADGVLIILVDAEVVKFATEHHEAFYDADNDKYMGNKVEDATQWLESVAGRLNGELGEDGSTLLSVALDKAIYTAVDQGDEGLVYED